MRRNINASDRDFCIRRKERWIKEGERGKLTSELSARYITRPLHGWLSARLGRREERGPRLLDAEKWMTERRA